MGDLFMGISRKLVSEVKHMRDGLFTCFLSESGSFSGLYAFEISVFRDFKAWS